MGDGRRATRGGRRPQCGDCLFQWKEGQKAAFACLGETDRPAVCAAVRPAFLQEMRKKRLPERARKMRAAFAPVQAGLAERPAARAEGREGDPYTEFGKASSREREWKDVRKK